VFVDAAVSCGVQDLPVVRQRTASRRLPEID